MGINVWCQHRDMFGEAKVKLYCMIAAQTRNAAAVWVFVYLRYKQGG